MHGDHLEFTNPGYTLCPADRTGRNPTAGYAPAVQCERVWITPTAARVGFQIS